MDTGNRKNFQSLIAFLLLAILSLPASFQIHHLVYEHQEITCSEGVLTHIHQDELDCELDHSQLPGFLFNIYSYPELKVAEYREEESFHIPTPPLTSFDQQVTLRGPPTLS